MSMVTTTNHDDEGWMKRMGSRLTVSMVMAFCMGCGGESAPAPAAPVAPLPPAPPVATTPPAPEPPPVVDASAPAPSAPAFTRKSLPLPGAVVPVGFDYLASDRATGRIYVPLSNSGSLAVLDVAAGTFSHVDGFKVATREIHGKPRTVGPTAVSAAGDVAYVGNRGTNEVCAVDTKAMKTGRCVKVAKPIDGVAYLPWAGEVWVTTPDDHSLAVLDAKHDLKLKTVVKTDGEPEGYGDDESRGLFFTNLEDKGGTVAIDVKTHAVKSTWNANCGSDGPRGLAVDRARGFVFVACTDHIQVLDAGHGGALLGRLDVGKGIDNIDYVADKSLLVATAGKDAVAVLAQADDKGNLSAIVAGAGVAGGRNGVADANGAIYVIDPQAGALVVLSR